MSAGVVGRIETVVQPVHRDWRLVIYANRAARFKVAGLACLDECHTFSRALSLSRRPLRNPTPFSGRGEGPYQSCAAYPDQRMTSNSFIINRRSRQQKSARRPTLPE